MENEKKRSRKPLALVATLIVVAALVVGGGTLWQRFQGDSPAVAAADSTTASDSTSVVETEEDEIARVPVEVAAAGLRTLPSYYNTTGTLEARRRVDLVSKAAGQIMRLRVEEGDFVQKNQVLAELDNREEAIQAEQARIRFETAERELARMKNMSERGLVTEREFDEKRELAEVAKFERDLAKVRLANTILRAPFRGQVSARHVELGQTVNVSDPLVGMVDTAPAEVRLFLPERIVRRLRVDQSVEIRPDIDPEAQLEGRIARIAPTVDPATSTVKVTVQVAGDLERARVGSFVRVRVTTDVHENAIAVPKRALVSEAGANYLFVAEADSVRKVSVMPGYSDDDFVEIAEKISAGDQVVVVGQGGLRNGSRIRVLAESDSGPLARGAQ